MYFRRLSALVLFCVLSPGPVVADEEATPGAEEAAPVLGRPIAHELNIAAHDESIITQSRAAQLVASMNELMRNAGPLCASVTYSLANPVVYDAKLSTIGVDVDLERNLKSNDPGANIFVVNQIDDCAGVQASGCTTVGAGPMIVIDEGGERAPVVWLHERGHAMGLGHVAQGISQENATPAQQANLMYWLALGGANKLDNVPGGTAQCKAYLNTAKSGVVALVGNPTVVRAAMTVPSEPLTPTGPPQTLTQAAASFFYGADAPGWNHGPPLDAIAKLTNQDVWSIGDTILTTRPLPAWAHMLTTLAYRQDPRFVGIVTYLLNLSSPNIPPASNMLTQDEKTIRDVLLEQKGALDRAKDNIPYSLGIYGYKTDDPRAAQLLTSFMDPSKAASVFNESGSFISTTAAPKYLGLATANAGNEDVSNIGATVQATVEPEAGAKLFEDRRFTFKSESARDAVLRSAPLPSRSLGTSETAVMNRAYEEGRTLGLDRYLTQQRPSSAP